MTDPRFAQAEQHYRRLKAELDAGRLSGDTFERAVWDSMFESGGRFWVLGANSGKWYASDGDDWVERNPLAEQPSVAPTPLAPGAPAAPPTDASDRTAAAQALRFLVLGALTAFVVFCVYSGYDAWMHGDRIGGAIAMGFGLFLLMTALGALVTRGSRR